MDLGRVVGRGECEVDDKDGLWESDKGGEDEEVSEQNTCLSAEYFVERQQFSPLWLDQFGVR